MGVDRGRRADRWTVGYGTPRWLAVVVTAPALIEGAVVWVHLGPTQGREQSGHRPAVVVSGRHYLETVTTLVAVLPVTSTDRGWPNHVRLRGHHGLDRPSWAMAEQVRTIDRGRITGVSGAVDGETLAGVRHLLRYYLDR